MAHDERKASDALVKALENEKIKYIFGIPGEENLDLLHSLRNSSIHLVVTRHEQAAGFMAATVGRMTGKCGVCLSTLGPGATNLATAAAYAQLAGFPMLMITGQKPIRKSKQGSFQIVDIVENMRPITKYTRQIPDGDLVPCCVREAVRVAEEEKPGAVHLELPEDIAGSLSEAPLFPVHSVRRPVAEAKAIEKAAAMVEASARPLLLIGAAANRKLTRKMLREFVDELGIPFATTQMGKGVIDETHPLYLGCCALSSGDFPHVAISSADLILNVGHDIVEKPPFIMSHGKPPIVVHVNFYSANVDNVYFPQHEVVGDIANAIWQLRLHLKRQPRWNFAFFLQVKEAMEKHLAKGVDDPSYPLCPQRVISDIRKVLPEDGVVCLDNGMYKIYFARSYRALQPNTLLLDNALATMGAGLPSAMAVSLLFPEKKVVAVCGDGGFMMNSQELETAVRLGLNLTVLVLNDNAYGMIKWKQHVAGFPELLLFPLFGLGLSNPNFVKYAESYGAKGYRVDSADHFREILTTCVHDERGVKLIEVPIDYTWANHILDTELPGIVDDMRQGSPQVISRELRSVTAIPETTESSFLESGTPHSASGNMSQKKFISQTHVQSLADSKQPKVYPFYLANKPVYKNEDLDIVNKYSGKVEAKCALANTSDIDVAIDATVKATEAMATMASFERKAVLEKVVVEVKERFEEFAQALCMEAGKPIKDARGEVQRLIDTFAVAAEESVRIYGEFAPMDISERARGYQAIVRRFPIGPVSMVSPFNFPLNLVAHKIAPALAVGCPFVLKPASKTPVGALMIGEILAKCNLPEGAFSILPCSRDGADLFTVDPRFKLLSFTGSPSVGWQMKARAGKKKVVLELGGNAACIVEDLVPDLNTVVSRIIFGAFYQSGQSCISVQRVYIREVSQMYFQYLGFCFLMVHLPLAPTAAQSLYEQVKNGLVQEAMGLKMGDPAEEETFIGPIISESEAKRIESWVKSAVEKGAKVLCGGKRSGVFHEATILEDVHPSSEVHSEEVFGPVMALIPYSGFKSAVAQVNDSKFGLQAGVFTTDINKSFYAFERLDVGGVCVNDIPSMRIDSMPYGGVKESGIGREGIRYAMEDMTEVRVMLMRNVGKLD